MNPKVLDETIEFLRSQLPEVERFLPKTLSNDEGRRAALNTLLSFWGPRDLPSWAEECIDELLSEEAEQRGVIEVRSLPVSNVAKVAIYRGNILRFRVGAIVNSISSTLEGGRVPLDSSLNAQIHKAIGPSFVRQIEETRKNGFNGRAFLSKAKNVPFSNVINAIVPQVQVRPTLSDERNLRKCYVDALKIAVGNSIKTVAFPCLGTGGNHFPKKEAARIAFEAVEDFFSDYPEAPIVIFVVNDDKNEEIYEELINGSI